MALSAAQNQKLATSAVTLPSGHAILNSPTAHVPFITVKNDLGTITNASTLASAHLTNGIINVAESPQIILSVVGILGSLTTYAITPQFRDVEVGNWQHLMVEDRSASTGGASRMVPLVFTFGANVDGMVSFSNPGATEMRLQVSSSGTVTNSALSISVGRGFNTHNPIVTD